MEASTMIKVKRALISVSDKTGIIEFAQALTKMKIEIISTGGTAKALADNKIPVRNISDFTGYPEMLDGRVKTLHPKVYGGLLALRNKKDHMQQVKKHKIELIDLVVVNLYPFEATLNKKDADHEEIIENIDIGGPTMLRAAAKNYRQVAVITDPADYPAILKEMEKNKGQIAEKTSLRLAVKVFATTSTYDTFINQYLAKAAGETNPFPASRQLVMEKVQDLRYGENPHQKAALYRIKNEKARTAAVTDIKQLHGKELSFNNILDLHANTEVVKEFTKEQVAVIMKHNNPCGVAVDQNQAEAYRKAFACDPASAFGGILGFNHEVTKETALEINKSFVECIVAPAYSQEAINILKEKKNIRLLQLTLNPGKNKTIFPNELDYKKVSGGLLAQDINDQLYSEKLAVVTRKKPTPQEMEALKFAWKICKHIKSNAILLTNHNQTLGIGAGQMSRVDSVKIAIMKMKENHVLAVQKKILVLASDAFFPFRDSIDEAKKAGVTAIIQPGGSIRDQEVIDACDEYNMAMVFTGMRHFRH
jgi:phosphoribosylaminoimidazolecarboxamide formyltransferase / IMP cyclohydrolase